MTHRRTRTARRAVGAGIVLALVVTACGTGTDDGDGPPTTTTSAPPTSVPPTSVPPSVPPTNAPPTSTPPTSAPPTTSPTPSTPAPTTPAPTPSKGTVLQRDDSGPEVMALQQRLTDLGYWLGTPDGEYGLLTAQAVLALQGVADIGRDGRVGPQTRMALDAGTRPAARSSTGSVTEIDRAAGVISFVQDGTVRLALHTSTGTFETYRHDGRTLLADTPEGRFDVTWTYDGWRDGALGNLYRPRYFHPDGIAVHGYTSVPAHPASHGCARVTIAAMDMVWAENLMPRSSAVWVY